MRLKEALRWGREALNASPSFALDARLLLETTLKASAASLLSRLEEDIDSSLFSRYQALIERRAKGEPVAKIIGKKEFYGRDFFVNKHVLDPRPDSETLIEAVLHNTKDIPQSAQPIKILELGVGSGCLLLTLLAELPQAQGVGVDISPQALLVAAKNARALDLAARVQWLESDLFQDVKGKFDIIISNPPYIPTQDIQALEREVRLFEPTLALDGGESGLDFYQRIAVEAPAFLKPHGFLALEAGFGQMNEIHRLFPLLSCVVYKDLSQIDRCILIKS